MGSKARGQILFIALLLVSAATVPTFVTGHDQVSKAETHDRVSSADVVQRQTINNSSTTPTPTPVPRHERPETTENSLPQLRGWYGMQMSEVLVDCTEGARARDWDACDLDQDYPSWLSDYVDIARETDNETDDTAAVTFRDTRDTQKTFNNQTQDFYETYEAYQRAAERGDQRRARQLAREAIAIASEVNTTGRDLRGQYRIITANSEANLTTTSDTVRNVTVNVSELARDLEVEAFTQTRLTVTVDSDRISFVRPLRVTGRLTVVNGTPLTNRTVSLQVANRTVQTTTNASGGYAFTYRPTTIDAGSVSLRTAYRPSQSSPFAGSNASTTVVVEQVEPNVSVTVEPSEAGFRDQLRVSGRVDVGTREVPDIPLTIALGGQPSTETRTGVDGRFETTIVVPADVTAGTQQVDADIAFAGRAIAQANGTTPVEIQPTPTTLTLNAKQVDATQQLAISGQLMTASGTPPSGEAITLFLNGTRVATTNVDGSGRFSTRVSIPPSILGATENATVPVRIRGEYTDSQTSLEDTQSTTTVEVRIPAEDERETILPFVPPLEVALSELFEGDGSVPWLLLLGLVLLLVAGFAIVARRRTLTQTFGSDLSTDAVWLWLGDLGPRFVGLFESLRSWWQDRFGESGSVESVDDDIEVEDSHEPATADSSPTKPPTTRERIQNLLSTDPDAAVILAYTTTRTELGRELDIPATDTHWEFLSACRDRLADSREYDALQTIVATHQKAAFGPMSLTQEAAERAVEMFDVLNERHSLNSGSPEADGGRSTDDR